MNDEQKRALVEALENPNGEIRPVGLPPGLATEHICSQCGGFHITPAGRHLAEAYREIERTVVGCHAQCKEIAEARDATRERASRLEAQLKAPDTWTPVEECGELVPGKYWGKNKEFDHSPVNGDAFLWDGKYWRDCDGNICRRPSHLVTRNGVPVRVPEVSE